MFQDLQLQFNSAYETEDSCCLRKYPDSTCLSSCERIAESLSKQVCSTLGCLTLQGLQICEWERFYVSYSRYTNLWPQISFRSQFVTILFPFFPLPSSFFSALRSTELAREPEQWRSAAGVPPRPPLQTGSEWRRLMKQG